MEEIISIFENQWIIVLLICILCSIAAVKIFQKLYLKQKLKRKSLANGALLLRETHRYVKKYSQDWDAMKDTVSSLKSHQVECLQQMNSSLRSSIQRLRENILLSVEEANLKSEQNCFAIQQEVRACSCELRALKTRFESAVESAEETRESACSADSWTQTSELNNRTKSDDVHGDSHQSRPAIIVIRNLLSEFLREAKKQLREERDLVLSDIRILFRQLEDDRKIIRSSLDYVLSNAVHYTQVSFEQFGSVGQDFVQRIASINSSSDALIKTQFQEFGQKIEILSECFRGLIYDMSMVKATLEDIEIQLEEMCRKVDEGLHISRQYSQEVADKVQKMVLKQDLDALNVGNLTHQLGTVKRIIEDWSALENNENKTDVYFEAEKATGNISEDFQNIESIKLRQFQEVLDKATTGLQRSSTVLLQRIQFLSNLVAALLQRSVEEKNASYYSLMFHSQNKIKDIEPFLNKSVINNNILENGTVPVENRSVLGDEDPNGHLNPCPAENHTKSKINNEVCFYNVSHLQSKSPNQKSKVFSNSKESDMKNEESKIMPESVD